MPDTVDLRAAAAIAELPPGIGHNAPPLPELLREETADLSTRTAELLGAVGRCAVSDEDTANRATTLARMIADHLKIVDNRRTERKAPILEAGRQIDGHFKTLADPLDGGKRKVVAMIDAYRKDQERLAAAERARLEAAAAKAREEAEAKAANAKTVEDEIAANEQISRAAALSEQAAQTTAAPIQSEYGAKAIARKVWRHEIEDPAVAFKYLLKTDRARTVEALSEIVGRLVRSGIHEMPGVKITADTETTIR
jgi:hypothetical protein